MSPNCVYGAICTSALVPMRGAPWAEELLRAPGGKKLGKQWPACCPAHDDKSPHLIIFGGRTGAVQVLCMAGCEPIEIISEILLHEVADRLSMTPPPGERWFTVVHRISPGARGRRHVLIFEDAKTDAGEGTCRKTYEALETRGACHHHRKCACRPAGGALFTDMPGEYWRIR